MKKKMNNKGFTLVELIVVLVILAILAAILVPALLGYIDRAKKQQIVLNAKSCLTAAQAEASNMYGQDKAPQDIKNVKDSAGKLRVLQTADVPKCTSLVIGFGEEYDKDHVTHDMYTVKYVKYQEDGDPIYFDGDAWTEVEPDASKQIGTVVLK